MDGSPDRLMRYRSVRDHMAEPTLSATQIVEGIRTGNLSIPDRVLIVRVLRETTPELVDVDPVLLPRIRAALGVSPEYIDTTRNALENSQVWQQSASTNPQELRKRRGFEEEHRSLIDEIQAYFNMLKYNVWYNHFVAVGLARNAYKVGVAMTGEAGRAIRHHLPIIAAARPTVGRKRNKPAEPAPTVPPVTTPKA